MDRTLRRGCDTTRFLAVSIPSEPTRPRADAVSRRRVLRVGSGGALALLIGVGAGALDRRSGREADGTAPESIRVSSTDTTTTSTTTTAAPVVVAEIGEIDPAIVTLGRRVIEATGVDDLDVLLGSLPGADGNPLERAAARVRDDFRAGDTMVIDGWVLASSEGRAAAAIAILCGDAC